MVSDMREIQSWARLLGLSCACFRAFDSSTVILRGVSKCRKRTNNFRLALKNFGPIL
jgi:hypothetical protein